MSVTTFDTLKFAQRLEQAAAFAEAQKEALETQLATKGDVQRMEKDLLLLRWMIGFNLAFTLALVWRVFA